MKFTAPMPRIDRSCCHVVRPGEYLIDTRDNKPCGIDRNTVECLICFKWYCLEYHWGPHSLEECK